jgi:hypothetical protein
LVKFSECVANRPSSTSTRANTFHRRGFFCPEQVNWIDHLPVDPASSCVAGAADQHQQPLDLLWIASSGLQENPMLGSAIASETLIAIIATT